MMNPDMGSSSIQKINLFVGTATRDLPSEVFLGYSLWFDGYVAAADNVRIVGRWLAAENGQRCTIVSICGGSVQEIQRGQPFNIDGVWTSLDDDADELRSLKAKALLELKEFIRSKIGNNASQ